MPRQFEFNPKKERQQLEKLYHRSRKVLEATLEKLENSDEISAAMLDSVFKVLKTASSILTDLEASSAKRKWEEVDRREAEQVMAELKADKPTRAPDEPDFGSIPEPPLELADLPFKVPLRTLEKK